ncbi:hypothetical protein K504DRAFT_519519 [Pleomassaria siparia CBS 279.74]|uniref:Uncharacterized protein n=1 Tax=Pleomassaria siparia CBS 279.74 TaxID=1314801 RepID=A0A6G1JTU6_9PLEO|nr:hypothetical protein K504DRAFT_519519 [Pleomassaria siparia CBS 279.74]
MQLSKLLGVLCLLAATSTALVIDKSAAEAGSHTLDVRNAGGTPNDVPSPIEDTGYCRGGPDFDSQHSLWFYSDELFKEPCMILNTDDNSQCHVIDEYVPFLSLYPLGSHPPISTFSELTERNRGSVAQAAHRVFLPVGSWDCWFYHEHDCSSDEYWIQYANGSDLPDGWKGKLGAFKCLRVD